MPSVKQIYYFSVDNELKLLILIIQILAVVFINSLL